MISLRQSKLKESLKSEGGTVNPSLKDLFKKLDRFSYSDMELDLIEREVKKVPAYIALIKKRTNK